MALSENPERSAGGVNNGPNRSRHWQGPRGSQQSRMLGNSKRDYFADNPRTARGPRPGRIQPCNHQTANEKGKSSQEWEAPPMANLEWSMKGRYLKNCNCIASCPCDTVGIPYPGKGCVGMAGMLIERGFYGAVRLDGLIWAVAYRWPGPLHEGNGEVQAFVDQNSNQQQRDGILKILSGQAGNPWFEFLASTITKAHEPQFVPIEFDFDKKHRRARIAIAGMLETVSAPLVIPNTGEEQHVRVQMPTGIEYREFEVAQAVTLKGTAAIRFDYRNTHSSMAEVEHTNLGIKVAD
jgi:hypothetical protein